MEGKIIEVFNILDRHTNILCDVSDIMRTQIGINNAVANALSHNKDILDKTTKKLNLTRLGVCVLGFGVYQQFKAQQRKIDKLQKEIDEMKGE